MNDKAVVCVYLCSFDYLVTVVYKKEEADLMNDEAVICRYLCRFDFLVTVVSVVGVFGELFDDSFYFIMVLRPFRLLR